MALPDDQRALLQLLVVRKKTPGEIATILEVDEAQVGSRTADALETIAPGGPAIPPAVALYLVGAADPITRADAVSLLDREPELTERSDRVREALSSEFQLDTPGVATKAEPSAARRGSEPKTTARGAGKRSEGAAPEPKSTGGESRGMDPRQRRLLSILISAAGLAIVVVAVVLLVNGEDPGSDPVEAPTVAELSPVRGETGGGSVEFGFSGNEFAANISFTSLKPNTPGESYALWFDGPVGAFPFERATVGGQGVIAGQSRINQAIICFIAADLFTDVKLSRSSDEQFRGALRQAVTARGGSGPFPEYVGTTVLEGPISMPTETRQALVRECGGRTSAGGSQGS
ncbi:MAG: hypothetical protein ACKOGM_08375 [Solirubrobacterales bacterium]